MNLVLILLFWGCDQHQRNGRVFQRYLFFPWSFALFPRALLGCSLVVVLVLGVGDGGARPVGFWRGFGMDSCSPSLISCSWHWSGSPTLSTSLSHFLSLALPFTPSLSVPIPRGLVLDFGIIKYVHYTIGPLYVGVLCLGRWRLQDGTHFISFGPISFDNS
jgi:hypothetical protein